MAQKIEYALSNHFTIVEIEYTPQGVPCAWLDDLNPSVIVPGHGPVCGIEGAKDMKEYLKYVYDEARYCYDNGLDVRKASRKIDLGPYVDWLCPGRIYMNIERAYREFRGEPADKPWDQAKTFDEIYRTASKRGLSTDF